VAATNILDTLPYADGASWNPSLVCLLGTRAGLLSDIWKWISSADITKTAEVFWLCDVAGAGKSAIAHTIAQKCSDNGILASSFFFDRNIPDRRSPQKLFSTIARDLVRLSEDVKDYIDQILEDDRSLASASQSRQFDELILKPFSQHHISRSVVIVIDGLDEGCNRETLSILREKVPKLPGNFRIIVTSRPTDDIRTDLLNAEHVQYRSIDIHSDTNQQDIALYIRDRLRYISSRKQLQADWPGEQYIGDFIRKAEGLFIWASTVSEYLLTVTYPHRKLSRLLYGENPSGLSADTNMDALYAEILSACNWRDEDFVHDYELVIGTVMAAKTPISSSALQSLHRGNPDLDVNEVLRPLSSLLTGLFHNTQPIRILHLSFRDFLTCRAQISPMYERFQVNEREHSQRLALSCLNVLNEDLNSSIPITGYLNRITFDTIPGVHGSPPLDVSRVSEALWYACRFWVEHLIEVQGPVPELFLDALRKLLTDKLIFWIEVLCSGYSFQSLRRVREWLQVSCIFRQTLHIS
jgi:hypothetical protein